MGAAEFLAGVVSAIPSLFEGMGNWVIDNSPKPLTDFGIEVFGTNDKLALLVGITVVSALIGAAVGVFARKRFGLATGVFVGFGVLAALAAASDPQVALGLAIP